MEDVTNYVKICEAIQAFCDLSLPTIQEVVEIWHQKQTLKPCVTPSICASYKKPTPKSGACQNCKDCGDAIEAVCHPPGRGVQWKNVNATLLHKDPVEVAKGFVFILPQGQTCKGFDDFDVGGILKMMMGFKEYHQGDQACLEKMQKVLDIRNGLSHMSVKNKMYVSDAQLDVYFDDIEDLICCLKSHHSALKADEIRSCLKQIQQSNVSTEMMKQALSPLTTGLEQALKDAFDDQTHHLQHFIAIQTQDLKQAIEESTTKGAEAVDTRLQPHLQKMSEEVREIQPKITSLKQTVENIREDVNRLVPAQTSCEQLDIQAVRDQLMSEYKQTRGKLQLLPGIPEECESMEDIFVDMLLCENQTKYGEVQQPRNLQSYSELVMLEDCKGQKVKRILVKGNPGCGKSTLISKLAYDWAKNDPESPYAQYQLLFAIDLREVVPGDNLLDVVTDQLLPEVSKEELDKYIKSHTESVLWLFDGYDEADPSFLAGNCGNIKDLLSSKLLPQSCMIITTRPHKVADINRRYKPYYAQVQLLGLSSDSVFNYISRFFQVPLGYVDWVNRFRGPFISTPQDPNFVEGPPANQLKKVNKVVTLIAQILHNELLHQMCQYPITLTMVCFLWKEEEEPALISTSLYFEAVVHLATHRLAKSDDSDLDTLCIKEQVHVLMLKLGKTAFAGLLENKLMLTEKEFDPDTLNEACQMGLILKEKKRSRRNLVNLISFLHKTFQEMSAAYYLASLADTDLALFNSDLATLLFEIEDTELMLRFCCGAHRKAAEIILSKSVKLSCLLRDKIEESGEKRCFLGHPDKELDPWRLPLLLLYESDYHLSKQESEQLHSLLNILVTKVKIEANCIETVSELWAVLGYFANQAQSGTSTWLASVTEAIIADATSADSSRNPGRSQFLLKDPVVAKAVSTMSALKRLTVYGSDFCDGTPLLQNMANSSQASTSLNHFVFQSYDFKPNSMAAFLSRQSYLTHLALKGATPPPPLVKVKKHPQEMTKVLDAIKSAPLKVLILDDICLYQYVTCLAPLLAQLTELQLSLMYVEETNDCKKLFEMFLDVGQKLPLVKLNLQGNEIGDSIQKFVEAFRYLSDLQYLNLRHISGGLEEHHFQFFGPSLKGLPNLTELDLTGRHIGSAMKELCQGLQHLKKLKVLSLHATKLTEESVPFLPFEHLVELNQLYLGGNKFSGAIGKLAERLKFLHKLRDFELSSIGLIDEDIALLPLSSFPNLISLDMCHNNLWSDGLCAISKQLKHMPHLEKLILHTQHQEVDDEHTRGIRHIEGIEALFRNLPHVPNLSALWLPDFHVVHSAFSKSPLLTKYALSVRAYDGRKTEVYRSREENLLLSSPVHRKEIKVIVDIVQKL